MELPLAGIWALIVMCTARLQAVGQAKPGPIRPNQARPKSRPDYGFGPAWDSGKPKPLAQAVAFIWFLGKCKGVPWRKINKFSVPWQIGMPNLEIGWRKRAWHTYRLLLHWAQLHSPNHYTLHMPHPSTAFCNLTTYEIPGSLTNIKLIAG